MPCFLPQSAQNHPSLLYRKIDKTVEIYKNSYLTIIPRARRPNGAKWVEWAIDSEAIRARGIIVLVKSNKLVKNIENKKIVAS